MEKYAFVFFNAVVICVLLSQVRGMKDVVRLFIKNVKIDEYNDTFKVLVKYDNHYILENVCTDIYRKCVQSIRDKCTRDNIRFSDYIEEIRGEDLDIQNIVVKRLRAENLASNNEDDFQSEIKSLEQKLKEIKTRGALRYHENTPLTEPMVTNNCADAVDPNEIHSIKQKLEHIATGLQKKDSELKRCQDMLSLQHKVIDNMSKSVSDLNEKMSMHEAKTSRCVNCTYVDCRFDEEVILYNEGTRVFRKDNHECQTLEGEFVRIPRNVHGVMNEDPFRITWKLKDGKEVTCKCDINNSSRSSYIVYKCK